ncbi:TIGR01777 family oxidoreductase [Leucobacter sp. OH1287]|uniref:TIGR01777 family oxidoreductase n=1 Tax=Leucobacter sp. OH1287 TaxID=2491049 RepID=UPI000F5D4E56|nr:TIGR01777 family oxidoreductase [Leucobacter sp. OH1287]RRD60348.1 TIGR01777 family protein [Leucobacter sp. OH1287]
MRRVVIAGGGGLLGSALSRELEERGYRVQHLVRAESAGNTGGGSAVKSGGGSASSAGNESGETTGDTGAYERLLWDPSRGELTDSHLAGAAAVVTLNGASIGRLPWTKSYRRELISSRLNPTTTVAKTINRLGKAAPAVWLSASATGFYGSQPGAELGEQSNAGSIFLAHLTRRWEAAAGTAASNTRLVSLRTGLVLDRNAMLKPLALLARLGINGPVGSGEQFWPWISKRDHVRAMATLIDNGSVAGPVNLVAPRAATANEIGGAVSACLGKPFLVPAPAPALRAVLGRDAADSLLLADARVIPEALLREGFKFQDSSVDEVIARELVSER